MAAPSRATQGAPQAGPSRAQQGDGTGDSQGRPSASSARPQQPSTAAAAPQAATEEFDTDGRSPRVAKFLRELDTASRQIETAITTTFQRLETEMWKRLTEAAEQWELEREDLAQQWSL